MRVAVVGVGHWHSGMYIPALQEIGADIVAISDPNEGALDRADVDCPRFTDHRELLEAAKPEFVFAHAPHCDMTEQAEAKGVFVAVALVTRYLALIEKLAELRDSGEMGRPVHYYSRLFAGAPQRYREMGVDWMLDPKRAGAGPLFNFGPHVIDIYLYLCHDPIETVAAFTTHALYGEKIEDLASVTFRGENGTLGVVETSYTHPDDYERYFSLTTDTLHVGGNIEGDTIRLRDGRLLDVEPDAAALDTYGLYTRDTLERFADGRPPKASISDMVPVLRVMNAAQRSIDMGQAVKLADVT